MEITRCAAAQSSHSPKVTGIGDMRSKPAPEFCFCLFFNVTSARFGEGSVSVERERETFMRVVRRLGCDGLWDSNVRWHCPIMLYHIFTFRQVLQIALDRFWQGGRHPLHLLPVAISGMEHPKAQVLNGALGMTPQGYPVLLLFFFCLRQLCFQDMFLKMVWMPVITELTESNRMPRFECFVGPLCTLCFRPAALCSIHAEIAQSSIHFNFILQGYWAVSIKSPEAAVEEVKSKRGIA